MGDSGDSPAEIRLGCQAGLPSCSPAPLDGAHQPVILPWAGGQPISGRSLALVDGAHELVRELRKVGGLARGIQRGLAAGARARLEALHCLLGKGQCLQSME